MHNVQSKLDDASNLFGIDMEPVSSDANNLSMSDFSFVTSPLKLFPISLMIIGLIIQLQQRLKSPRLIADLCCRIITHLDLIYVI
jgi:hypothetical protein